MHVYSAFLRNRPALELVRRLISKRAEVPTLNIAVLGCSIGAEVYSILWVLRSARPDLEIVVHAVDVSQEVVDIAEAGIYAPGMSDVVDSGIFDRLTESEMQGMFDREGARARVKDWLREGIEWSVDDACDPELRSRLGSQDIVVANNFLAASRRQARSAAFATLLGSSSRAATSLYPVSISRYERTSPGI